MSEPLLPDLATLVAAELSTEFDLVAKYNPTPFYTLTELTELKVDVYPAQLRRPAGQRAGRTKLAMVDVVIQQQAKSIAKHDELTNLADAMLTFLLDKRWEPGGWISNEGGFSNDDTNNRQAKYDDNRFETVIRVQFMWNPGG